MDAERLSMTVTFGAVAGLVVAVLLPFALIPGTGVGTYYSWWTLGPVSLVVVAVLVAFAIVLRSLDVIGPETLAGLTLGLGLWLVLVAVGWSVSVPRPLVMGIPTFEAMLYHRWVLVAFAALAFLTSIWYASQVLSSPGRSEAAD
jgi:hypothetical protein